MPVFSPLTVKVQESAPVDSAGDIEAKLSALLDEARSSGLPDSVTLRLVMNWAAKRAYEGGGYGVAKALSLNALEEILFRASR